MRLLKCYRALSCLCFLRMSILSLWTTSLFLEPELNEWMLRLYPTLKIWFTTKCLKLLSLSWLHRESKLYVFKWPYLTFFAFFLGVLVIGGKETNFFLPNEILREPIRYLPVLGCRNSYQISLQQGLIIRLNSFYLKSQILCLRIFILTMFSLSYNFLQNCFYKFTILLISSMRSKSLRIALRTLLKFSFHSSCERMWSWASIRSNSASREYV